MNPTLSIHLWSLLAGNAASAAVAVACKTVLDRWFS